MGRTEENLCPFSRPTHTHLKKWWTPYWWNWSWSHRHSFWDFWSFSEKIYGFFAYSKINKQNQQKHTQYWRWNSPDFGPFCMISDMCFAMISRSCPRLAFSFDRLACVLVSIYCFLIFPIMPSASQSSHTKKFNISEVFLFSCHEDEGL